MNKAQLLVGVASLVVASSAFAQGTFTLSNLNTPGRPLIYDRDGVTPIAGANFLVDVLVKNPTSGNFEAVLRNGAAFSGVAPLTGANAGLFNASGMSVPFIAPGAGAEMMVRAWDVTSGATFASALYKGDVTFTVAALGGAGTPPSLPATLANFTSFALVPEPSTYALAALGLGSLLLFRRK
jgi:hypothetical protein